MSATSHPQFQAAAPATELCHQLHQQMESSRAKAAVMNEDGVYELSSGRTNQAIVCLQGSLNLLLQLCHTQPFAGTPGSNRDDPRPTEKVQAPYLQDELFYLYPHAISYEVSSPSTFDLVFDCSMVLFNLALAYHQKAIASGQAADTDSLRQALVYYQESLQALQSLHALQRQTTDDVSNDDDLIVFLMLAAMNNQSQILYQHPRLLMHKEDPQQSFQTLLNLSMKAMDEAVNTDRHDQWSMVEVAQIQDFVQNAMVFRLPRPCVAPTA